MAALCHNRQPQEQPCHITVLFFFHFTIYNCSPAAEWQQKESCPLIHPNRIVWDFTFLIAPSISDCLRPAGRG